MNSNPKKRYRTLRVRTLARSFASVRLGTSKGQSLYLGRTSQTLVSTLMHSLTQYHSTLIQQQQQQQQYRCGPCQASKPALERLATQYASSHNDHFESHSQVVPFGIVYEHKLGDSIHNFHIRAFPTYVLFVQSVEVNRIEGVNLEGIQQMIQTSATTTTTTTVESGIAYTSSERSTGQNLGGKESLTEEAAREQRLARFSTSATVMATAPATEESKDVEMAESETESISVNPDNEQLNHHEHDNQNQKEESIMVDPTLKLDKDDLQTLTESMGFSILRSQKGLLKGNGGVEGAVEWLTLHQDDVDIDDPIQQESAVAQSYKCNECGRLFSNMANLELHANKTGHSDFEESTQTIKPLTAEEKAEKILEIRELLKVKRSEREEGEKVDEVEREKQRRFMGKEMNKTREQLDQETRKREAQLRRKEKQMFEKERERIRAELAKDKAERVANKGKLSSRLGVDGYNPDGIQYDRVDSVTVVSGTQNEKAKSGNSVVKIDECIKKVAAYRAGGDGGNCLKILKAYIGNVVENPADEKFRTINMENKAFKGKVKPFVGAKQLLIAVGFKQNKSGDLLVLDEDADLKLLVDAKTKIEVAYAAY